MMWYCPASGDVEDPDTGFDECCAQPDQHVTPPTIANAVVAELGNWMLGQVGDEGLRDTIWEQWPPFQGLTREDQDRIFAAVYQEIFG